MGLLSDYSSPKKALPTKSPRSLLKAYVRLPESVGLGSDTFDTCYSSETALAPIAGTAGTMADTRSLPNRA